jgi:lipopolysaccharide/colanic/teichoic acid biosynthesis glycosyltransferase
VNKVETFNTQEKIEHPIGKSIPLFRLFDSDVHMYQMLLEQKALASAQRNGKDTGCDEESEIRSIYAIPADGSQLAKFSIAEFLYTCFERSFALIALILSIPIMLVEAILLRIESPGPILFAMARIGTSKPCLGSELLTVPYLKPPSSEENFDPNKYYYYPQLFRFIKFRSMYVDAKERFPERYTYTYSESEFLENSYTDPEDPRVTPLGQWLRKLSIDELPNFWSVLIGDIRLVGPRPDLPAFLPSYPEDAIFKFSVKPGITGLAQISGRGMLGIKETIDYDLEYIERRTIWLDLQILVKTIWYVIAKRGAF